MLNLTNPDQLIEDIIITAFFMSKQSNNDSNNYKLILQNLKSRFPQKLTDTIKKTTYNIAILLTKSVTSPEFASVAQASSYLTNYDVPLLDYYNFLRSIDKDLALFENNGQINLLETPLVSLELQKIMNDFKKSESPFYINKKK